MDFLLVFILALLTFISRIFNLLKVPIFTDEAIYIRWAQIGLADPAHRYISLTDGKQPLFTWLMYPFLMIFNDPLYAGRFVSVASAVLAVIGIYLVSKTLFNRTTAVLAGLLYLICPFVVVYDRLALMDSLLAAFAVWSLYLEILLIKYLRLDVALILGLTIGFGLLTKSSALFYILLLPASWLIFDRKGKSKLSVIIKWLGFSFLSILIAQIMYNSLRLSPYFYIIEQKNYSFIMPVSAFLSQPFKYFLPNLYGLTSFLVEYLTIPVIVLIIISLVFAVIGKKRRIFFLFLWFIFPFLTLAAFGIVLFPRFILFMTLPLLIIAANLLADLYYFLRVRFKSLYLILGLILIYPFYVSWMLIFNPVRAAIPKIDRNQLFDDWPSGYGVREVIDYLDNQARNKTIVIGTEGTFGLNPAVYEIYLKQNKNIIIKGYWPVGEVPRELLDYARNYPTYLVFKEKQVIPSDWPLKLIAKYKRGLGNTFLYFYQVVPENGSI